MATIHVPTSEPLLRSLSMLAAARGTTMREEVNEACTAHVERKSHLVMSVAREMARDPVDIGVPSETNSRQDSSE